VGAFYEKAYKSSEDGTIKRWQIIKALKDVAITMIDPRITKKVFEGSADAIIFNWQNPILRDRLLRHAFNLARKQVGVA